MIRMDEELIQKLIMGGIILILLGVGVLYLNINKTTEEISKASKCGEVIDVIYEQCSEETHIDLTTIKGRARTLTYENGVCVIK